jgi:hypothetical protein
LWGRDFAAWTITFPNSHLRVCTTIQTTVPALCSHNSSR